MGGAGPIPPPSPAVPAAPAGNAAPVLLGEGVAVKLPERLQDLLRPVVLTGTVAGQTAEGLTRIRTQLGEVLIDLAATLSADKPVTVQIAAGQPPGRAMVFANAPAAPQNAGQAAGTPLPPQTRPAGAQPAVLLNLPAATAPTLPTAAVPLLPGAILPALVLAAAKAAATAAPSAPAAQAVPAAPWPAAAPTAATATASPAAAPSPSPTPPAAQPGTALPPSGPPMDAPVELGGDAAHPGAASPQPGGAKAEGKPDGKPDPAAPPRPAPQGTPQGTPQGNARPLPPLPGDAAPQPAAHADPAPVLIQGATVALKIVSVAQPGPTSPAPAQAPAAGTPPADPDGPVLHGTVAGATPQGQPILATRAGMLVLTNQGPLPAGTKISVVLTDPLRAQQAAAPHAADEPPAPRDWPALRQVMEALAAADPELARTLSNSILPQPNKKLGAALTFLLSAMRGGDARGWLGEEAVNTLERTGQATLLKQMEEEFRAPSRPPADAPADWKPFAVPMLEGAVLQSLQLQLRRIDPDEGGGAAGERAAGGSRFLLELELSRFGPLQLDGLVRPQRFDLILRSHLPLPPDLTAELTGVFSGSLGAMGFTGALSFQTGARSWVKLTRAGRAGLGVTA